MDSPPTLELQQEEPYKGQASPRFPLVGLGASAGGISALQTFFTGMPADSGMAFVVVLHLAPDHESTLAQILQQRTAMPVIQVTENVKVEPNHVYVIPPNKHLSMQDSMIQLVTPQQPVGRRVAIDLFFRTLSVAYGSRAVCIVLSGTDSDGVIGIKHVKEQGGITIAQDPIEAEFDSMPRGAIATGMVDWILPVALMPPQLMEFMHNEQQMHVPPEALPDGEADREDGNSGGPLRIQQVPSTTDEEALTLVLRFLRGQTGHDFTHYKRATILRRVARRMQVNLLENIPAYLDFLRAHPAENTALLHDLLISVTNFFRDQESFAALSAHIPQLFADKQSGDQVRVWVAGCATGEEAYSVAILLAEHAGRLDAPPSILVFATDLDEDVIHAARAGLYPVTIEADVSQERLRRFFQRDQVSYRIRKEIRELVLFSAHNLLRDSPFSRLDLVTCRNLLIYLKREAQESVYDTFHFALRPGGLLFLGNSESIDEVSLQFAALDKRHHLYVRRTGARPSWLIPSLTAPAPSPRALATPVLPRSRPPNLKLEPPQPIISPDVLSVLSPGERPLPLFGNLHLALLEQYAPPSIVINSSYDIVHLTEHAGRFLQFSGEPSTNLLKVIHPTLRLELRTALYRAVQSNVNITVPYVPLDEAGAPRRLNIHVRPVLKSEATEGFILIVFEPVEEAEEPLRAALADREPLARHLENEIEYLKAQLSSTIEQYEATVEELQASNEELQAINEEMRSASEELETGKEELQSINEELSTVNQELKSKVEDLSRANSDLQNLMVSTDIGTIFLDRQLQIKRFTPRIQTLFNLIPTDIGRPLSDITHKLNYVELKADVERVLQDLRTSEREVRSDGHWYIGRILPYRTLEDRIDGVVLTFVDITARKHAEEVHIALEREVAILAERNRVAHELHDTMSQGFIAIKLQMEAAEIGLTDATVDTAVHMRRAREIAQQSLIEARRSVHGLHSQLIENGSLLSVLERLAERATNGIQVVFTTEGNLYSLPVEIESGVYRVAQEALTNALRHALPQHILLELSYMPTQVRLRIHDDGQGFDTARRSEGIGMLGMKERANRLGGELTVTSQPGNGTEILLTVDIGKEVSTDSTSLLTLP